LTLSLSSLLKRHPFPVEAHFDRAVALSFAFPEAVVRPLVPSSLAIDTHEGLAFVTVAMVWTRALRPAGFPVALGQDFFLAGYRVFTRLQEPSGRRLRGLRILRSDTDQRRMVWAGNLMTGYRYRHVVVDVQMSGMTTQVRTVDGSGATTLDVSFSAPDGAVSLPEGSPFRDWTEARRFAGPMPFTFSPEDELTMVVVEGSRQHWEPRPITVHNWRVALFDESPFRETTPILANAFMVEDVAYHWKRGRVVHLADPRA
jgi:uncharacterized protein YqjF (DUF2071 family)